eukprot:CAMPEP_0194737380 /NCGR_PEP_ID=MMETSP0296-20130528/80861_1 /TAXON_ID=39354 /ORGANISM="Heterosigma akashiwo, Strain CCMP2393" /LENGTH=89 /DNA_ID=CAMNT_0039647299 /DNA_START=30 /DNA_END=295 /DNA_ORIENTATION=+
MYPSRLHSHSICPNSESVLRPSSSSCSSMLPHSESLLLPSPKMLAYSSEKADSDKGADPPEPEKFRAGFPVYPFSINSCLNFHLFMTLA